MNLTAWLFCIGSLAACLGVSALLYPHAALESEQMALLSTPQPMENFEQVVDLGEDYGVYRLHRSCGVLPGESSGQSAGGAGAGRQTRVWRLLGRLVLMVCIALTHASTHAMSHMGETTRIPSGVWTAIDARPKADCSTLSVRDARCLPAQSLVASQGPGAGQLVSFYHMLWLLGRSVCRNTSEWLCLPASSDAYALGALLQALVGHSGVSVWTKAWSDYSRLRTPGPGTQGLLRTRYWAAPVRRVYCVSVGLDAQVSPIGA